MNLSQLKIGDSAKVLVVRGKDKERQHLLDMGLIPDVDVKLVKRAPMGDPLELNIYGYELAIRNEQAENIEVRKITSKEKKQEQKEIFDYCQDYKELKDSNHQVLNTEDLYKLSKLHNCDLCRKNCKFNPNIYSSKKLKSTHGGKLIKDELINETEHPGFGEPGRFHNKNNENPLPVDKTINFALVGNPNSGKTTLFNAITGSNQHVGNFPGVTVDRKDGKIKDYDNTNITDLPGIYSLSPYSSEERISREFILYDDVDCIINILDATNIERSLYLTMQLIELEHPMVVALNMMDELAENEGTVLVNKLEYALGVPVVPISASKKQGIDELVDHAMHIAKFQELPIVQDFCVADDRGGSVHRALHSIMHIIEDHCANDNDSANHLHKIPVRFASEKIVENDRLVYDSLDLNKEDIKAIEHIVKHMEDECKLDRSALISDMRYRFIIRLVKLCVIKGRANVHRKRSEAVDKVLTGKWTGIPSFIVIMGIIFWLTFNVVGYNLQKLFAFGINSLADVCSQAMVNAKVNEVVQSFIMDGLFAGVGTIISFLPIIVVMFFFLSILEDSGYMARVAFVMDRALRKIGLSGRSIVPLLIGFGCSVPAIMSTRTLPSERDRKLTIMLIPFMSCSAKLPIYAFISSIFFPNNAALVMLCLYLGAIFIGIIVALFLKGRTKPVPFIMELPNYRMPSPRNVGHLLWDKCKDFLHRAFTIILIATIVIWFLQSFDMSLYFIVDTNASILAKLAGFISPIFIPIGLADWRIVTSLISGLLMKESVVASMGVLFNSVSEITAIFTSVMAISFLVFCLLYTPCVASIASIRRELGWRYALLIAVLQCLIAWLASFVVYNICLIF